ncbi:nucleotidyl transferase AbiEii/AbiGii toxin family protein [Companilactobacillus jidongensis]|uniref:nucleotidyl transferase AbiEii/AbiGii toxin family protein n=1 Tax=Companilactobacillus jidongensis TaxID=2486006 RepID=UPI000F7A843D|nr:nucleotidyl transferase AbiEii/AbiGii toxin family protein [Companilactobacillus jidongensis]
MKLDFSDKKQFLYNVRKIAREKKVTPQIMLQEVILDDLLDRISYSEYCDNLILKGGFLIGSILGISTRSTRDIDTSVTGILVSKEKMKEVFTEICVIKVPEDIINLKIRKIEDIREEAEYSGYRIYIDASVYSTNVDIKIDISTGDVITEHAISYGHKLLLEDRVINIMTYNIETIIAEKLETAVSRMELNTRLKDFYDLYLFCNSGKLEIDFNLLHKALLATNNNRNTGIMLDKYYERLNVLKNNKEMNKKWKLYQARNIYTQGIDFKDTCDASIKLILRAIKK